MDSLKVSDEKKKYITEVLNPILEALVTDCLAVQPEDTGAWILDWLKKKQGSAGGGGSADLATENQELEKTVRRMSALMDEAAQTISNLAGKEAEEEEEEEEEEDDDVDEIPENFIKPEGQMKTARASVSAEAYGAWNQKVEFTPPVYAKTDEQKERLSGVLSKSFLFSALEGKDLSQVIDAMEEKAATSGETLVKQGDDGDFLFVVESGALDCVRKEGEEDKVLKTCEAGDVFGELALLYNCPRAANVVAKDACVLWKLDRNTFNAIVKDAAAKKRERYESFLKQVPLLSGLDAYEKSQVADAFKSEKYKDGEEIVKENEPGDKFYVIEDGACVAEKAGDKMMDYKVGDYFGELALLRNQPRAATVKAAGDVTVLSLDRRTFKRLLGGLEDILKERMASY